jgi:uncharacterized membrane protein YphA (DoxX/SURF4 family)
MQATYPSAEPGVSRRAIAGADPALAAYRALYAWFIVLPIAAGLDKFAMLLAEWPQYLSPVIASAIPLDPILFMYAVGIIEIGAGILVAIRPRIGGLVVAAWLVAIAVNLVLHPAGYLDIAVRDIGLAVGAFALSRLAVPYWRRLAR